jgi:hypothetical protein
MKTDNYKNNQNIVISVDQFLKKSFIISANQCLKKYLAKLFTVY